MTGVESPSGRRLGGLAVLLAAVLGLFLGPGAAAARPGELDPTFNLAPADFSPYGALAIDDTGRVYLGGSDENGAVVGRLHPDGALDLSFGDGDGTRSPPPEVEDIINPYGLALTPSGSLITMCERVGVGVGEDCLWVDDPEDPDPGVIHRVGSNHYRGSVFTGPPTSLVIGPAGGIAMLANSPVRDEQRLGRTIYRFRADGSEATEFRDGGAFTIYRGTPLWRPRQLKFDSQGRLIILTGRGIARLHREGARDLSFGRHGFFRSDWIRKFALDGSDRIVAMGRVGREARVVRLGPNGRRDPSFSRDGVVRLRELPARFTPRTLVLESGDRTVIGFSAYDPNQTPADPADRAAGFRLLRLDARGRRDSAFGSGGWVQHPMYNATVIAFAVTPQRRLLVEVIRHFREPGDPRVDGRVRLLAFRLD